MICFVIQKMSVRQRMIISILEACHRFREVQNRLAKDCFTEKTKYLIIRTNCFVLYARNWEERKPEKEMWLMKFPGLIMCPVEYSFGIQMRILTHSCRFLWIKIFWILFDMRRYGMQWGI